MQSSPTIYLNCNFQFRLKGKLSNVGEFDIDCYHQHTWLTPASIYWVLISVEGGSNLLNESTQPLGLEMPYWDGENPPEV